MFDLPFDDVSTVADYRPRPPYAQKNIIAEPLKVERSTVTKLVITGAARLDPITVFLEDFGRRDCPTESDPNYQTAKGKITINCWDNS